MKIKKLNTFEYTLKDEELSHFLESFVNLLANEELTEDSEISNFIHNHLGYIITECEK